MPQIASVITYSDLTGNVVISTDSIRVDNIIVANFSANPIVAIFRIGDRTGNPILRIAVAAKESQVFEGKWMADQGLSVDLIDLNVHVTVIHGASGA